LGKEVERHCGEGGEEKRRAPREDSKTGGEIEKRQGGPGIYVNGYGMKADISRFNKTWERAKRDAQEASTRSV